MANLLKKDKDTENKGETTLADTGNKAEKKEEVKGKKRSKFIIALYAAAGIVTAYGGYMIFYSISYIKEYYTSYSMSVTDDLPSVIQYIITSSIVYFIYGLILLTGARILKRVTGFQPPAH